MQIKNAEDLFRLYDFEGDLRLKIRQYLNADTKLLPKINALCLGAEKFKSQATPIYTDTYLLKMEKCLLFIKILKIK
ncbi:hypothetical protein YZ54_06530 [Campylobacter upsaliensis]|uniref:Uncharacterized protein n=1 Tax=Campylobacter upsaliensis TaxID=28080 RepID=A0A5L4DHL8_CAMUP|nr:hypothetical protein [Campylobacter upsaliensis]